MHGRREPRFVRHHAQSSESFDGFRESMNERLGSSCVTNIECRWAASQTKIPVTCQWSHHLKHRAVCHNEPDKLPAVRTAQGDGLRVKIFAIHVQGRQRCDQVRSLQLAVCYIRICETEATDPNVGTPAAGETPKSALLSEPCCSTKQE